MIEFEEHFYSDDPDQGHPDVRTRLKGASYFFLGNGLIQAAVQFAPEGEGTPLGLLIMNPDRLLAKREALTFDPQTGLENTMMRICVNDNRSEILPRDVLVKWSGDHRSPEVQAVWSGGNIEIRETYYCPDFSSPTLIREVCLNCLSDKSVELVIKTGIRQESFEKKVFLSPDKPATVCFKYTLNPSTNTVDIEVKEGLFEKKQALEHWRRFSDISFNNPLLDFYYNASRFQLQAAISSAGRVDGSIWQYNREWVRDQSVMVVGLTLAGFHELARTMLSRLLHEFVTEEGDTIDSSEKRDPDEIELDQNGALLYALRNYVVWTGDTDIISENWKKISTTAEFPLSEVFLHEPSGLSTNRREYWERHKAHGIETGIELIYQVFTSIGFSCAASLARMISRADEAVRWEEQGMRIKDAILNHPQFSLVDNRGFIKRRDIDGSVQETIVPTSEARLPEEIPLVSAGDHFLNPDTCCVLPIAFGFVPPESKIAKLTLDNLEVLWNQGWKDGGYGRYHMSSEPDSPGSWPFPSLFIARACMESGDYENVWRILRWLNTIPGAQAGSWFENYGPRISPPYPQVGVVPWTWAEMLILLINHLVGIWPEENHIKIKPKLIPGVDNIAGEFPVRGSRLHLDIKKDPSVVALEFRTNAEVKQSSEHEIIVGYSSGDLYIEVSVPG